jgi:ABC-type lipoprotein release transport system permease subunit
VVWRMAWRNAWRNPRRTGIVVVAVAVGIAGSLLSMAINFGMVAQMVDTAIATELGHVQVHAPGFEDATQLEALLPDGGRAARVVLDELPGVRGWAARVESEGLVNSPRASAGVRVVAVQPEREKSVSLLSDSLVAGSWFDGRPRQVLIGEVLARRLQVGVGDKIVLSVQDAGGDLTGEAVRVVGLFRTPSRDLDQGAVFLTLKDAQRLFGLGQAVSEIVVVTDDRDDIPAVAQALKKSLGDHAEVRTWEQLQPLLVYLVDSFDVIGWYVYGAVFVAMAFGIANVLLMAVYERTREIGMLMAIGMSRRRVVVSVALESVLVTLFGIAVGVGVAVAGAFSLRDGIDLSAFAEGLTAYGVGTRIVPVMRAQDFVVPVVVGGLTALLASLWPALRAARLRPAEALRHV